MQYRICSASTLLALCWSISGFAQAPDPAASNRELIGTGPKVDIQTSANATLDVGGAGAVNPNVTGQNLRGNLGASSLQPGPAARPPLPNLGLPNNSFETPSFAPDLRSIAPGRSATKQEMRAAEELILPRFRSSSSSGGISQLALAQQADSWRYRYFNQRWWYWRSDDTWAYWDGSQWRERAARR